MCVLLMQRGLDTSELWISSCPEFYPLLANGVNRVHLSESVSSTVSISVTSAGNESHPAIADEDSIGSPKPKCWQTSTPLTFCAPFPKWVTMIHRSEPTQWLVL